MELLLKTLVLIAQVYLGMCGKALFFQPTNIPDTQSLAIIPLTVTSSQQQTPLSNLSACIRLKVHHFREKTYVFSYATSDKDNNELNMGLKIHGVFIALGGSYLHSWENVTIVPGVWFHFCFVTEDEQYTVYVNGQPNRVLEISRRSILTNGSLVLGQESDQVLGGFQEQQSFSGIITDFNFYSRALTAKEVQDIAECSNKAQEGDLVAWSSTVMIPKGNVLDMNIAKEEFCSVSKQISIFPERKLHDQALHWCDNLKATIALPRSQQENENLFAMSEPFLSVCQPPNHATLFLWVGATDKISNGEHRDYMGKLLNYSNFVGSSKSSSKSCVAMKIPPEEGGWDDVSCGKTYSFCVACEESIPTTLKMRGLCEDDFQALMFRLSPKYGQKTGFRGFTKYEIYFDEDTLTWTLWDMWTNVTAATYFAYDSSYPLGTHKWQLATDYYVCGKPKDSEHMLALSACYDWEYSCEDATCINLTQRCDMRVDCPDASDEKSCEKLSLPSDYLATLTPPGVEPGPLKMNLNISLIGFSEINLRDMKMTVDFKMALSWSDIRLQYLNLKELADINLIEISKVWTPKVEYMNADFPFVYETPATLKVKRAAPAEPDDPILVKHDEVYMGSKNPLLMSKKVNAPFSCALDLKNFPFDTQRCQLLLRLSSARLEFLQWNQLEVYYLGEVWLTEYKVDKVDIESQEEEEYSMAVISITFRRRFWFYITSSYLPTVMLMLISYTSLYLKRDNVDLRVMMTLTALLVLYALYQQIADGLPRTSYTKAIDVWCFFAITFIFSQVIFQVLVDIRIKPKPKRDRNRVSILLQRICWSEGSKPEVNEKWDEEEEVKEYDEKTSKPLRAARIGYAIIVLLFLIIYWTVVISNMEN